VRLVEFVSEFVCSSVRLIVADDDLVGSSCGLDQALVVGASDVGDRDDSVFAFECRVRVCWVFLAGFVGLGHGLECCA
jgi:hypothetical protein